MDGEFAGTVVYNASKDVDVTAFWEPELLCTKMRSLVAWLGNGGNNHLRAKAELVGHVVSLVSLGVVPVHGLNKWLIIRRTPRVHRVQVWDEAVAET